MQILACATQGTGSDDENRLRALVSACDARFFEFNKRDKRQSAWRLLRTLRSRQFDLLVLEGSGIAGGIAAILARLLWGVPYVLSSGDAVGPFLSGRTPLGSPVFSLYEKWLYACSAGFIGWTPYLVGRALTYGAPRAITIPGWAPFAMDRPSLEAARRSIRTRFKIPEHAVLFGLIGSLNWSSRYSYCYGSELVRAARLAGSQAYVLVVGDGSGIDSLRALAGSALDSSIFLPGRIAREEVPAYLAAMDIGSIPQSVDGVGSFRYTTKMSEYHAAGLPFISNQIPMAYDLDAGNVWRLPGKSPWDPEFIRALADLMSNLTQADIHARMHSGQASTVFDKDTQILRATAFLRDILHMVRAGS